MPGNKYLKVKIDGEELELPAEGVNLSINFRLEAVVGINLDIILIHFIPIDRREKDGEVFRSGR